MNKFQLDLVENYTNNSQRIRIMSEAWAENNLFCPMCEGLLKKVNNNSPAHDFDCSSETCYEQFELKSCSSIIDKKILCGSYASLIQRIQDQSSLNLYIIKYDKIDFSVTEVLFIPSYFLLEEIIEKENLFHLQLKEQVGLGGIY